MFDHIFSKFLKIVSLLGPDSRPSFEDELTQPTVDTSETSNEQQSSATPGRDLQNFFMRRMSDILTQLVTRTTSETDQESPETGIPTATNNPQSNDSNASSHSSTTDSSHTQSPTQAQNTTTETNTTTHSNEEDSQSNVSFSRKSRIYV